MWRHRVTTLSCKATTKQVGRVGRACKQGAGQALGWARGARRRAGAACKRGACLRGVRGAGLAARALGKRHGHWSRGLCTRAGLDWVLGTSDSI